MTRMGKATRLAGMTVVIGLVLTAFGVASNVGSAALPIITNGSFESGDYTGWTLSEDSGVPFFGTWGIASTGLTINSGDFTFDFHDGLLVQQFSPGLPITYAATDGTFLAYQLQRGSERHRMFQDITLNADTTLTWDMQYQDHFGAFSASQFLAVHIRDLSDSILQTLFITTQSVDPQSIPMTSFSADLSAFTGSTVRLDVEMNVQNFFFDAAFDNFATELQVQEVSIDIKPGSDPNSINCNNEKEVIAVAVLTTDDFDATTVDHTTVTFEGASETHVDKKSGEPRRHEEDVDGDGDTDLVFHFRLGDTGLTCDSTEATLTGATFDGQAIEGTDSVRMVP